MNYVEYRFTLNPLLPAREVLIAELAERGFESFVEEESGLLAYIPEALHHADVAARTLAESLCEEGFAMECRIIPQENWNAQWEASFSPIEVDDFVRIRAPFHPSAPGFEWELCIEPRMSFGTGHHATTWLMMKAMRALDFREKEVLDMGSGTGILAILAEKLGAIRVDAIDNDEWADENARENATRNGCSRIRCRLGDARLLAGERYDVILANINRNILVQDAGAYIQTLRPGGKILLSGFYLQDIPAVLQAFPPLVKTGEECREDWAQLTLSLE